MPETTPISKADTGLANASAGAILVGSGPGAIPVTTANLSFNTGTNTLAIGAVAAVPTVNCGVQGGTLADPTPRTLLIQTPIVADQGSWSTLVEAALFSGVMNSVTHIAINNPRDPTYPPVTSQPSWGIGIEGNWYESTTGKTTVEFYAQLLGPPDDGVIGVGRIQARPIYITMDRVTGSARTYIELGKAQSGFGEFGVSVSVDKNHANDFAVFRINAGASAALSPIYLYGPVVGPIRIVGNDVPGDPVSAARNTTGLIFSPNTSVQGVEFLTATPGNGYGFRIRTQDPSTGTVYYKVQSRANSATFVDNFTIGSDFTAVFAGSVAIGGGVPIKKHFAVAAPVDFGSVNAQSTLGADVTVTGVTTGLNEVTVTPRSAPESGLSFFGRVKTTDTVTVYCLNATGSPIDPANNTYDVIVNSH